ncbi:uncharacterized protein LOC125229460 isoform X1 [Leguminivora glycinivorella]|uniref:uncharacterized protein LOC125229460 isoform X1 n=1 Tax=Leguminivora glycinivorella TaxID=1035111 RepID=UPI0020109658|nr:uncharacterized protein LOC125229460 isoform X1 [Leguminivora glycinivorella]
MDIALPACAQLRQTGTVITKPKDDCYRICTGRTNFVSTLKCELCGRTRTNSQYSDCDSETVKKCRPHRSSTARSRYVNVCAAVCLLLLVGFTPRTSAAPRPRRDSMENEAWANPCDFAPDSSPSSPKPFTKAQAKRVANQAKAALDNAQSFKNNFSDSIQSFPSFSETFDTTPWLRNKPFVTQYTFPETKNKIEMELPAEDLSNVVANIDDHLPAMYKALKMVAAGLYAIKENGLKQDVREEKNLKPFFDHYFNAVRQVLCEFNEVMLSKNLQILPLPDNEIPLIGENRTDTMFHIYRDTMLYLDYLRQVMDHWAHSP